MDNVTFSIIVPIYKIEQYIGQCIDSVLEQNFDSYELILVEDGSPDRCPEICDRYSEKDERVKVIHKQNGGIFEARKSGADVTVGEYIICLDGDDWLEPTYLSDFAEIIRIYEPDIICCGYYKAYCQQKIECRLAIGTGLYDKKKIEKVVYPYLIEDAQGRYFPPMIWAKAYKRELYKRQQQVSGFVSVGEDHACSKSCIYHANSMYILDKCLYNYRQNLDSMTKKPKAFSWEGPIAIGKHFEKQIDILKGDFQKQVYRNVVHNLFNVAVSQFHREESYRIIRRDIINHISDPYYQTAIKGCNYRNNWKGMMAKFALQYKQIWVLFLYNQINVRHSK